MGLLATLAVAGCAAMVQVPPSEYLQDHHPSSVRVTTTHDLTLYLDNPKITGNTLWGMAFGAVQVLPLSNVKGVEVRRIAVARTALLVGGVGIAMFALVELTHCPRLAPDGSGGCGNAPIKT